MIGDTISSPNCRGLYQTRSTQRYASHRAGEEGVLTVHIFQVVSQYDRYVYRRQCLETMTGE